MIVVNPSTRQFNIPGADLVFGVTADASAVIKEFQCPRYVGNNLDLTGCFIRINYRNANGEVDSYLVSDVTVDGDNIVFGWELSPRVTMYKGNVSFVMCVVGPDTKVAWHTTLGRGQVLEGLEPEWESVMDETVDVVAQLVAMVEAQTKAVADTGAEWVRNVQSEGTDQIVAVQTAGRESREAAVAEIEAKGVNVRESIPDDYTSLENTVDGLVRGRAGAIVCEAAGSAVVVNDASDLPMQGMKIFGRSTQDGTPTPDAPVEIKSVVEPVVTVCGKNLVNIHRTDVGKVNASVEVDGDSIIVATVADDALSRAIVPVQYPTNVPLTISFDATILQGYDFMDYKAMDVYMRSGSTVLGSTNLDPTADKRSYTASIPGGIPDTGYSLWLYIKTKAEYVGAVEIKFENIQIEIGSEATEYEPYKALQTVELTHTLLGIPVTSGGNYTDSDGQQWICDEVDLERGVYVKRTNKYIVNGSDIETWKISSLQSVEGATRFDMYIVGLRAGQQVCLCSHYPGQEKANKYPETCWCNSTGNASYFEFRIVTADTTTVDEIKAMVQANPVEVVYALYTPIETALSETEIAAYRAMHSNYPNTTVLNDAGAHMVVKYAADTKLYIDNKIAALIGG